MLRLLAKALVFFLLFANLSWVAHAEVLVAGGGSCMSITTAVPDDAPETGVSNHFKVVHDGACDHSCHGSAHFVGMAPGPFDHPPLFSSAAPGGNGIHFLSRDTEPPLPPPNIRLS